MFSVSDPAFPLPIEGGAEYIHGRAAAHSSLLRAAGVIPVDVADAHFLYQEGSLEPAEGFFAKAGELLGGLELTDDLSLEAFLNHPKTDADEHTKTLTRTLVEGFDAADPARASAAALAEEWRGGANEEGAQFRPLGGYGGLLRFLVRAITPKVTLLLQTVVRELRWLEGEVEVACERFGQQEIFRARRVIITLPLSLLKPETPGAVRFSPPLAEKEEALTGLELGPVVKVLLKFAKAFWEDREEGRYVNAAYFHHPDAPFPTFWTPLPLRASVLTAWAGGPKAARLSACSEDEIIGAALASLERLFPNMPHPEVARVYDRQRDPFSRGAYSFVTVGGVGAREKLAEPLGNTLFFAGEATNTEGEAGTVYGALQSGVRVAQEVLDAL